MTEKASEFRQMVYRASKRENNWDSDLPSDAGGGFSQLLRLGGGFVFGAVVTCHHTTLNHIVKQGAPLFPRSLRKGWEARMTGVPNG